MDLDRAERGVMGWGVVLCEQIICISVGDGFQRRELELRWEDEERRTIGVLLEKDGGRRCYCCCCFDALAHFELER